MKILFTGDIMPGGVLPYQREYISNSLLKFMHDFDLRVGTLESAMGDNLAFDEEKMNGKMNIIFSPSKELNRVVEMGFNVVTLANNHVFDLGEEGLRNTINILNKAGIKHCGAGMNAKDAAQPAVVDFDGKTIAFLAYCQYGSVYIGHVKGATDTAPGLNLLDIERCEREIRDAKSKYDYVFVLPHWGHEHQFLPTPEIKQWAKQMIDAGADGVFGSHTHRIQPMIKYHQAPIAFSMGNFLFPDYCMSPPRPIWYPDDEAVIPSLPRIPFYPNHIDSPCFHLWPYLSRIGMIVSCDVNNDSIKAEYRLTFLDNDNILDWYQHPRAMRNRMSWMGAMIKSGIYPMLFRFYHSKWNVVRRGYHFIHGFIK